MRVLSISDVNRACATQLSRSAHKAPYASTRTRSALLRAFAELLIDCEEDRTLRAVLVGMLREAR
jgi:hypothetical protein